MYVTHKYHSQNWLETSCQIKSQLCFILPIHPCKCDFLTLSSMKISDTNYFQSLISSASSWSILWFIQIESVLVIAVRKCRHRSAKHNVREFSQCLLSCIQFTFVCLGFLSFHFLCSFKSAFPVGGSRFILAWLEAFGFVCFYNI